MPRFYKPPDWRYVVTDLDSVAVTFLDRIASDRVIEYDLNTPTSIAGLVPSASGEVNRLHTDGDPYLAEGNRMLYAFRDEGPVGGPWVIRAAGVILDMEDDGELATAHSRFTALDPWGLLYTRQCVDNVGDLPGPLGLEFLATPVGEIALQLLKNTIVNTGTVRLDAGDSTRLAEGAQYADWGGTGFYEGFIADTTPIDYIVERGKTVGEAWEDLCATGLMDLEIVAIYDIDERLGYLGYLNVYSQPPDESQAGNQPRGQPRPRAIFSWDNPPRTLAGIRRRTDGSARANWIQFYTRAGQLAAGLLDDATSITKYGQYEYVQFFPDQVDPDRVGQWATSQLDIRKRGVRSVIPLPAQQQPPFLWDDFFVGDHVPVYSSNRLRETVPDADQPDVYQRVYGITVSLADSSGTERITDVRVSQDGIVT